MPQENVSTEVRGWSCVRDQIFLIFKDAFKPYREIVKRSKTVIHNVVIKKIYQNKINKAIWKKVGVDTT